MINEILKTEQARIAADKADKQAQDVARLKLMNFLISQVAELLVEEFNAAGYRGSYLNFRDRATPGELNLSPVTLTHNKAEGCLQVGYTPNDPNYRVQKVITIEPSWGGEFNGLFYTLHRGSQLTTLQFTDPVECATVFVKDVVLVKYAPYQVGAK